MTTKFGRKASPLAIVSRMKRIVVLLLAVAAAFPGQAAAQGSGGMIAYEFCAYSEWLGDFICNVNLVAGDGSGGTLVGDGINPALSPDGSRIALVGYSQRGLFVLNLADGSLTNVHGSGESPAWSRDATKLAF